LSCNISPYKYRLLAVLSDGKCTSFVTKKMIAASSFSYQVRKRVLAQHMKKNLAFFFPDAAVVPRATLHPGPGDKVTRKRVRTEPSAVLVDGSAPSHHCPRHSCPVHPFSQGYIQLCPSKDSRYRLNVPLLIFLDKLKQLSCFREKQAWSLC
jgi:hypothetical protein